MLTTYNFFPTFWFLSEHTIYKTYTILSIRVLYTASLIDVKALFDGVELQLCSFEVLALKLTPAPVTLLNRESVVKKEENLSRKFFSLFHFYQCLCYNSQGKKAQEVSVRAMWIEYLCPPITYPSWSLLNDENVYSAHSEPCNADNLSYPTFINLSDY